jgi:5,5'-dehydrodivanillate O-demethylase
MNAPLISRQRTVRLSESAQARVELSELDHVGPGTLAGRYLRRFWHPVYHAADLEPGQIKPLRILAEDFTLYRGQDGAAHVVGPRCPHRGMLLTPGWVEGDSIRCFYHGWRFDGSGQCVEQPAERPPFCHKIQLPSYPTREYLGLVFAYFGEGEPPEFPRYPTFEEEGVYLHTDSYTRACSFFSNMDNATDFSHIAFAHGDASVSWDEHTDGPEISARETIWGIELSAVRPSGRRKVSQIGMPNIYHIRGVPNDPEVAYRELIGWWTPHEDDRHTQFTVVALRGPSDMVERYKKRRAEEQARRDLDREALARAALAGTIRQEDVDRQRTSIIFLQDDIAQMGVGQIGDRPTEHLGRGDVGVIATRKVWLRELRKFAAGEPVKAWTYDHKQLPVHVDYL